MTQQLATGCCSAISPCRHQQRDPGTICGVCQRAVGVVGGPIKLAYDRAKRTIVAQRHVVGEGERR